MRSQVRWSVLSFWSRQLFLYLSFVLICYATNNDLPVQGCHIFWRRRTQYTVERTLWGSSVASKSFAGLLFEQDHLLFPFSFSPLLLLPLFAVRIKEPSFNAISSLLIRLIALVTAAVYLSIVCFNLSCHEPPRPTRLSHILTKYYSVRSTVERTLWVSSVSSKSFACR
jgi:hypothetical protein